MNSNYEVELIEELTAMFPWLDCDPDDFGGYFDDDAEKPTSKRVMACSVSLMGK